MNDDNKVNDGLNEKKAQDEIFKEFLANNDKENLLGDSNQKFNNPDKIQMDELNVHEEVLKPKEDQKLNIKILVDKQRASKEKEINTEKPKDAIVGEASDTKKK